MLVKRIKRKLFGNRIGFLIRSGKINRIKNLREFRYKELRCYIDKLNKEDASGVMEQLFEHNCKKLRNKESINVGFVVYSPSEWQCEEIYRQMEKDDLFVPQIIISGFRAGATEETYNRTVGFFKSGYNTVCIGYDDKYNDQIVKMLDGFDILIYISPYDSALQPDYANAYHRKLDQLLIHIPYAIYIDQLPKMFNCTLIKCAWMNIYMTESIKQYHYEVSSIGDYNVYCMGYPKLDDYKKITVSDKDVWKINEQTKCKIILAPHFIDKDVGTFNKNYEWFYNYAKDHPETSWVLKPHPRMAKGVFSSVEEWYEYLNKWDALPNASVRLMGDYYDLFATSDTMILDSLSFLAEYQITGKPMLFLQSDCPRKMNDLGEKLMNHVYVCNGDDFDTIESYIEETWKKDPMKPERDSFRNSEFQMNMYGDVSERIVTQIKGLLKDQ